ncbi:MAG: glycosyltransferase N-terminal domain-containing protein, partial [Gammaproteobacteria bacterium]
MPRFTYTVLFYILSPIYFFRLFIRGFSNSSYLLRWNERLGLSHLSPTQGKDLIWIHAVSVGEVNASIPLLRKLMESHPLAEFLVTTSTPTGSDVLLERIGSRIKHQYLPLDLPSCIGRFLNNWNPKILIILETEIWPNLINCCKERGISTVLVNARLSKKSRDKYLPFVSLISPTISSIDLILAQFESDKQRFISLSDDINIALCGNLKFDQNIAEEMNSIVESIRSEWSIEGKQRPTLIAASTHDTEETA